MRTYIVTGATQGLGLATARALARDPGRRVVLAGGWPFGRYGPTNRPPVASYVQHDTYGSREPGRKTGHVTALGAPPAEARARAQQAADCIRCGVQP